VQESLSREEAEELMARVDRDRACYLQANYGKAWDEAGSYDCVFNTGSLTYDQVVELLVEELEVKESLATPEAKAYLMELALAHRLKARLATHPKVLAPTLNVLLEGGAILVSGVIHTPQEQHLVQEIAREVCGSRAVRFDLRHRG
jgi:osmotically-inducible protein OsmY